MSATASPLIARLLAQRETWCVLREAAPDQPELKVKLRRPPEGDLHRFDRKPGDEHKVQVIRAVIDYAVDWAGFSEAELLGPALGSSDPLTFDRTLWGEVVRDRADWIAVTFSHLMGQISAHLQAAASTAKN